jgi:hypothetical protein
MRRNHKVSETLSKQVMDATTSQGFGRSYDSTSYKMMAMI